MSYIYLLEQGEESSAESFSDMPAFVLSRLNLTVEKSCCKGSETASCQSSPSGTTCEPSTESRGADSLTLCAEDSRVKTYPSLTQTEMDSKGNGLDCGEKWPESLAKFDRDTCLWKTRQGLLFEDSTECLEILPEWGMTVGGELWELAMPGWLIIVNVFGYLPTPTKVNILVAKRIEDGESHRNLAEVIYERERDEGRNTLGNLNPQMTELLMGWPIKWTDLQPLAMGKFQQWLSSHGKL